MVTKIHGGIINQQMLTGSVRYFQIASEGPPYFVNTIGNAGALAVLATVVSSGNGSYISGDTLTVVGGSGTSPTIVIADQTPVTGPVRPAIVNGTIALYTITPGNLVPLTTTESLAFNDNDPLADTIVGSGVSFITQGFVPGMEIVISGSSGGGANDGTYTIAGVTATTLTLELNVSNALTTAIAASAKITATSAILPNPVSVTGGTGTGATFNIDWSSTIIIPNAEIGTGGPEFYVGYNKPVPGSAVDQILGVISERADIVQVAVTSGVLLQVAVANTGFAWDENDDGDAAAEMQTAIRALGAAVVVPDTTNSGTTVDLSSIDVTERFFNNGIAP